MDEIAKLTYPQILLLNHASSYNRKRMDQQIMKNRAMGKASQSEQVADDLVIDGKKITEMTSEEIFGLHGMDAPKPKVIKPKRRE